MVIPSCSFIVMIFSRHISWERNKRHLLTYCCHGYWDLQSPYCQLCFSAFGLFSLPLILKWFRCKLRLLYLLNSNARCWVKVEFTINGECFSKSMSCLAFERDATKKLLFSLVYINLKLFLSQGIAQCLAHHKPSKIGKEKAQGQMFGWPSGCSLVSRELWLSQC